MTYTITHRYGNMDRDTPLAEFPHLLAELEDCPEDTEHGSIALTHETEWSISTSRDGHVVFEHLENGGERHMTSVQKDEVIRMWELLSQGKIVELESLPWRPGYK